MAATIAPITGVRLSLISEPGTGYCLAFDELMVRLIDGRCMLIDV